MLVFTPEVVPDGDPLAALDACVEHVGVVQVRIKELGRSAGPTPARATFDWTRRVLEVGSRLGDDAPLVVVNDRVDVAAALAPEGCAGCHVGADDCPPREARAVLGEDLLLGLSTHSMSAASGWTTRTSW
jgi:thiamine-phosphate pyrophosphorylase